MPCSWRSVSSMETVYSANWVDRCPGGRGVSLLWFREAVSCAGRAALRPQRRVWCEDAFGGYVVHDDAPADAEPADQRREAGRVADAAVGEEQVEGCLAGHDVEGVAGDHLDPR